MLSIRTQDRMFLVPYNRPIRIYGERIYLESWANDEDTDNDILLGKYATKERALEVLDEIQWCIQKISKDKDVFKEYAVYEMPKE